MEDLAGAAEDDAAGRDPPAEDTGLEAAGGAGTTVAVAVAVGRPVHLWQTVVAVTVIVLVWVMGTVRVLVPLVVVV